MTTAPATPGPGIRLSGDAPPSHPHPAPPADTVTTTHGNRPTAPRHRADPNAVRAAKAAWRSYQLDVAARRRNRDSLALAGADTKEARR